MKVGILTWYDVLNYGSAFQAYALQRTIEDIGESAEILMHDRKMPDYYGNRIIKSNIQGVLRWIRNQTPNRRKNRSESKRKFKTFQEFYKKNLNVGSHYSQTNADCVLIGSDQIFDVNGMYYPFQFGEGISCNNISTYAPCFGETTLNSLVENEKYDEICESIRKLNEVNARDENTKQILENILGNTVEKVLDPTLLYQFEKEKYIWNERLIKEKYCIIYTWGGFSVSSEFAEQCKAFAKRNGLKLVSVGEPRIWCDVQFSSASPIEFFELFMHADMVLTNMFHGTCFSIIMEKPFYSFLMPHNRNKLGGLLSYLELETQALNDSKELEKLLIPNLNYRVINQRIEKERGKSIQMLKKAISIK